MRNLLERVAAIGVHFAVGWNNQDGITQGSFESGRRFDNGKPLGLRATLGCGHSHCQESKCDDLYLINTNISKWSCTIVLISIKMTNEIKTYEFHFDFFVKFYCLCLRRRKKGVWWLSSSSVFLYEPISCKEIVLASLSTNFFYSGVSAICATHIFFSRLYATWIYLHYILWFVCFTECADGWCKWRDIFFL